MKKVKAKYIGESNFGDIIDQMVNKILSDIDSSSFLKDNIIKNTEYFNTKFVKATYLIHIEKYISDNEFTYNDVSLHYGSYYYELILNIVGAIKIVCKIRKTPDDYFVIELRAISSLMLKMPKPMVTKYYKVDQVHELLKFSKELVKIVHGR